MKNTDKHAEETRENILQAAEERFQTYGYNKTTMIEIASDVGMSAANLYRYYTNKQDIAAACAQQCIGSQIEMLRAAVQQTGLSAAEKLHQCTQEMLRYTHETTSQQPKLNELVNVIVSDRQDIVHNKIQQSCALLAEVLAQGNDSGEFAVDDVNKTAHTVYNALKLFHVPIFMSLYDLETLQQKARDVVDLLILGLAKR
ncbi:MAG: TetR/AcrR family transcriptional regulator [Gammaproteobacteria bacterium]|nr:TetR/AcrR family transcriptional regulator [Gammaproteobacteria bacterium]